MKQSKIVIQSDTHFPGTKPRLSNAKKPMDMIEMGEYFGYPPCCITEFMEYVFKYLNGGKMDRGVRKLHGTGYVPCIECNDKNEEELLFYIKNNRKCSTSFPKADF